MITVALRFIEARGESAGLAEIAAQADDFEAMVGFDEIGHEFKAAVRGRVVNEEDFVGTSDLFEDGGEAIVERKNGVFFVVNGDDD